MGVSYYSHGGEKGGFITISAILGHSKLTTSLIYSHTDKEKMRRAVERIL